MSVETRGGGITKLSELIIDADKNWEVHRIVNLPEPINGKEPSVKDITVLSLPPSNKYKIKNIYFDPAINLVAVEYDDTPAP